MPALPELQRAFARHVRGEDDAGMLEQVRGKRLDPAERLDIYRNNLIGNLTEALAVDFPAVSRLVGEGFFTAAAARFISTHPSRSGNLQGFGAGFVGFLAGLQQAAGVPYLADVARLEWARQEALLAADADPLDTGVLAAADAAFRLVPHPSVRLVASIYPILSLWLYCQEAEPGEPPAIACGERVLVWRRDDGVNMLALDAGDYAFLAACDAGLVLGRALEKAESADPDFDLGVCLRRYLEGGVFAAA